jgi:hypothetical protein
MEKLSLKSYGWKCILGSEMLLILCWLGGFLPLRSEAGISLHHELFETFPGVTWGTSGGFILMLAYVFVFSWVFAWYYVWMHNSSLVNK